MAYVSFNKSLTSVQIEALTGATAGKLYFSSDYKGIYIIGTDKTAHKVADNFQIKSISAEITVGSIIQYVGPTVGGIKNGYFYKVAQDGWDEVEVFDVSGKADKAASPTNNHLAALDANGNLKDSGKSLSDIALSTTLAESVADDKGFAMCMAIVHLSNVSTLTSVTNVEWYYVITDSQGKVLCGIKKDGKAYIYATIEEIISCIVSSYNT